MTTHTINAPFSLAKSSPASSRQNGTSQAYQAVASIAVAALITAAGFLVIGLQSPAATHSAVSAQAPITIQHVHKAVSQPATMEIVAAPVEGTPDAFFEGTGDGSAGGWTSQQ
jgi:hypothetical protein